MIEHINLDKLNGDFKKIKIGELSQEVIDQLNLKREPADIVMWKDRFKYIKKHRKDFNSNADFELNVSLIPHVIKNPDYVGFHANKNSLEFVKRINELIMIVVRLRTKGDLAFRTMYPISDEQLKKYIRNGTIKEVKNNILPYK